MAFCSAGCREVVDATRFWSKVDKSGGSDACWPWTGSTDPKGYGWFSTGTTMRHAHRVALELTLGRRLMGRKECALHHCDNPSCCNPNQNKHVHLGTHLMNYYEMRARGREAKACGAANPKTKLTPAQVQSIRAARAAWRTANPGRFRVTKGSSVSTGALAAKYGVSGAAITSVLHARTHAGLP